MAKETKKTTKQEKEVLDTTKKVTTAFKDVEEKPENAPADAAKEEPKETVNGEQTVIQPEDTPKEEPKEKVEENKPASGPVKLGYNYVYTWNGMMYD